MDIVSGVVVYILLWWWVLFMVLPFGAKAPERVGRGPRNFSSGKAAHGFETCHHNRDFSGFVYNCLFYHSLWYLQFS